MFDIDQQQHKILVLNEIICDNKAESKSQYTLKLYDINTFQLIYETMVHKNFLVGRLESSYFTFSGGHVYYGNNAIKIRHDLIKDSNSFNYSNDDIIDIYSDVFDLDEGQKINSRTPLESIKSHKFAYLITNQLKLKACKIMIIPYLHDHKIYLNQIKVNTTYFYTSVETTVKAYDNLNARQLNVFSPEEKINL